MKLAANMERSQLEELIFNELKDLPKLPDGWRYDFDFAQKYDEDSKACNFVVTAKPMQYLVCGEVCGDNRFQIIEKAKADIMEHTNIETSPEEMAVLDNFLFRAWQMGWLNKYNL